MATLAQNQNRHGRRVVLDDRLRLVYRGGGAGLTGAFLVVFGILGLTDPESGSSAPAGAWRWAWRATGR
ncbi:hypothetical protein [Streptomyces sp. H34-S4]|uniref:hypothetical protein n=1 Tax=Streptomyces sp. H34-S4 TaxID=2996463 RepID=UPI00226EDBFF|nr:hypothetical protein [Streptomyces sp. H34-S4]MCY0936928.1 hypothetical protein [Streptomyces sp. H34-S4]